MRVTMQVKIIGRKYLVNRGELQAVNMPNFFSLVVKCLKRKGRIFLTKKKAYSNKAKTVFAVDLRTANY